MDFIQGNEKYNTQTLLFLNGEMVQGFDANHTRAFLKPDTEYDAAFYCYFDEIEPYSALMPQMVTVCQKTEKAYFDFSVPYEAMMALDAGCEQYAVILHHLELAANLLDLRVPYSDEYYQSIDKLIEYLADAFYQSKACSGEVTVACVGQTHIDVAWLWPLRQTVEKVQRSFSTVCSLMEKYPEYSFMATSPQLYLYSKEYAPELYKKVKKLIADGKWEAEGAMWLEADINLPSGESLVRQLLYGKRFLKEEFGVESKVLWIPDVFGYSASLPQILKKAGVDKFVTGKISWNDTNRIPNDTFIWRGIDGTEIFTHFLTTKDFTNTDPTRFFAMLNGALDAREIKSTWDLYRNKEYNNTILHTFGFGDGGGGPTYQMLEKQRRFSCGIPGIPKTKMSTITGFLAEAEKNFTKACKKYGRTPKWSGELYLELHRGTYTSMANTKRLNRKCEFAISEAEKLSVINMLLNNAEYPDFSENWKVMLLNQFHDIIPGSSIKEVYDTSDKQYSEVLQSCKNISDAVCKSIAEKIPGTGYAVFNYNSFEGSGIVKTDKGYAYAENIPPMGYAVSDGLSFDNDAEINPKGISNSFFDIKLNENGEIISLFDKRCNREVFSADANKFCVHEDDPYAFDAWEITHYYNQKCYSMDDGAEISEYRDGAKAGLSIKRSFMQSEIRQNIIVYDHIPRIDFETEIDWKQKNLLVKALFPIAVFSDKVSAEIQFGNVERPTHSNTSWDEAQFEMCMHKWVDISDNGYGVSILNDCKYGFSADENVLGITLLKSSTFPNPDADKCLHKFTYSIYPHTGQVFSGGTIRQAYSLNQPMTAIKLLDETQEELPQSFSFVSCDSENIIIETVKMAEDGDGIIIRLYDAYNVSSSVKLRLGVEIKEAYICDLLENNLQSLDIANNELNLSVKNFEIVSVKIKC